MTHTQERSRIGKPRTVPLIGGPMDGREKPYDGPEPKDVLTFSVAGRTHRYHLKVRGTNFIYIAEGFHGKLIDGTDVS